MALYIFLSIDVMHTAGDHVSKVVLVPYPTIDFSYGRGEEKRGITTMVSTLVGTKMAILYFYWKKMSIDVMKVIGENANS